LLATTWSLVCEIRTPTQACQDRPHQEGHRGRWIPAVLAHHRAVAAMLALSVEGFFGDCSLIPTGFRRNPLSYRRLAMILASISGMVQKRRFSGNTRNLSADLDRSRVGAGFRESLAAMLGLQFRENRVYPRSSSQ